MEDSVRKFGNSTAILDAEVEGLNYIETAKQINDINPKIICFVVYGQQPSASTQNMQGAVGSAEELKKLNSRCFTLFVGAHVAALPDETLKKEKSIDAVCQNEGVYTILDLLKVEKLNDDYYLSKVKGLCFRGSDGVIKKNQLSTIVPRKNLVEELPGMAWDLLPPLSKYRTASWHSWSNDSEKENFASLYTSLGCPYRCSFCMINIINRTNQDSNISSEDSNIFRWWPPEFTISQFDYIANQGVKNIKIADELFVLNPNHFKTICSLIKDRGYDFNIWAYSRIDTCKPEYLNILADSGVKWLGLGIENPNEVLRKEIHKDGYKEVKILDIINMIQSSGINVSGNYIYGLPNDTKESMQATLSFALDNITEMVNFYSAMAYPGSPLYFKAKKLNRKLPDNYVGYSQHAYETLNLSNENLSSESILLFRDKAWQKYHSNPKYLNLLEKKFGKPAREDLEKTIKIKLKRKILGD